MSFEVTGFLKQSSNPFAEERAIDFISEEIHVTSGKDSSPEQNREAREDLNP